MNNGVSPVSCGHLKGGYRLCVGRSGVGLPGKGRLQDSRPVSWGDSEGAGDVCREPPGFGGIHS